jgi:hypothetical protein
MTRAVVSILAAVTLVFGAVACGGDDSNDEFKDQYNEAVRPLNQLGDDVVASLTSAGEGSDRELARRLDNYADRAEQTRRRLSELDPPGDTRDQFDDLLAALEQSVADLRAVGASAKEGDPAEAQEATKDLIESGQRLRSAESDFRNAVEG